MAFRVNTNISSLNTQRWLGISGGEQSRALERLSSGYKINKAADDAAGIAITSKLTVKSVSMVKSIDNGNQAMSMLQTAEGGMDQISNILTRLKEIATQSASDNTTDRTSLDLERSYLEEEISKIAQNTKYGTTALLQGGKTATSLGTNLTTSNGIVNIDVSNALTTAGSTFTITMAGNDGAGNANLTLTNGASTQTVAVSGLTGFTTATANFSSFGIKVTVNAAAATITTGGGFKVTSGSGGTTTTSVTNLGANLVPARGIVSLTASAGATVGSYRAGFATMTMTNEPIFELYDPSDNLLASAMGTVDMSAPGATDTVTIAAYGITVTVDHNLILTSSSAATAFDVTSTTTPGVASAFDFQLGDTNSTNNQIAVSLKNFDSGSSGVLGLTGNIGTQAAAQAYMSVLDNAMNNLATERGNLGASMNQVSYHVANLQTMNENIRSSVSTIKDADFAKEMADFTRGQILQQSGVAMLAQANSIPQQVLSLLKG